MALIPESIGVVLPQYVGNDDEIDMDVLTQISEAVANGVGVACALDAAGITWNRFFRFKRENDVVREMFDAAREAQAELFADQTIEIADSLATNDDDVTLAQVQTARVRIDTRKWHTSVMDSKRFGNKMHHDVDVTVSLKDVLDAANQRRERIIELNSNEFTTDEQSVASLNAPIDDDPDMVDMLD